MCKFVRLLVPWDSVTHDPMPVVGPHDDELAKVLQMGAESTFNDCIEVRAYLSNTICLYKTMLNESERLESREPAFYYHTDHLGSTSRFTDDSGKVVQTLAYMPYGEDWVDDSKFIYSDTNHIGIYQFNGKERDFESGFYYYGARYHWPELWTGWTTPDPLMDKYPGISPYNYCTWNPVIFVDPDGRKIKFANNATKKQISQFYVAVKYLSDHNCGGRFNQLRSSKLTYTIAFVNNLLEEKYDPNTRTIFWSPTMGILTDENVVLSPSTILNHEMTHATRDDNINILLQEGYKAEYHRQKELHKEQVRDGSSLQYDNIEEEQIINGVEKRTAFQLGEIKEGQVTRKNHKGQKVRVADPTSNIPLDNPHK